MRHLMHRSLYTIEQACEILRMTEDQVKAACRTGRLRSLELETETWIPRQDVERLYSSRSYSAVPSRADLDELRKEVEYLRSTVEVLKLGLGAGARKKKWTEEELLFFHQFCMDSLSRGKWATTDIAHFCDDLFTLEESHLATLRIRKGYGAWICIFDLVRRMISGCEQHPDYPRGGLGPVTERLDRAKDRLLGLFHMGEHISTPLDPVDARRIREAVFVNTAVIDKYIAGKIARELHIRKG